VDKPFKLAAQYHNTIKPQNHDTTTPSAHRSLQAKEGQNQNTTTPNPKPKPGNTKTPDNQKTINPRNHPTPPSVPIKKAIKE